MAAQEYFVDWSKADDSGDGLSLGNAKKHVNAALALITTPIDDEVLIQVVGDAGNPENFIYQDATDANIDLTTYNMSDPNARIVFRLYGWDNAKYTGGSQAPDGGASWAVGNVKPATLAPLRVDYGRVDVVGLGISDPSGQYPAASTGPNGELTLDYCRLSGGLAGLRGDGAMTVVNCYITDNDFGILCEDGDVALVGRNILHDNRTAGIRNRFRGRVSCMPWWELPTSKYQTTISTASPKGAYAVVVLETDSIMIVSDILPDFAGGGRDTQAAAELQIVNTSLVSGKTYLGVYLKSRSMFVGKEQTRFNDESVNSGADTLPESKQFVHEDGEGTLVID